MIPAGLQNRPERRSVCGKSRELPQTVGAVGRTRKRLDYFVGNLQRNESSILVFIDIEDNGACHGMQQIAGGQVTIRLKHHLQGERDV
jgi:hypothetical protein